MTCGIGSPYYMSPEMLRGDQKYTRAVDVYSFSIMCVEIWNEQPPFSEMHFDTPFAFARYVLEDNRPSIREDCPKDLATMVERCWAADRLDRPPFAEIVAVLKPIVKEVESSTPDNTVHVIPRKVDIPEDSGTNKGRTKGRTKTKTKTRNPTYTNTTNATRNKNRKTNHHHKSSDVELDSVQSSTMQHTGGKPSLTVSVVPSSDPSSPTTPGTTTTVSKSPVAITTTANPAEVPLDNSDNGKLVESTE